MVRRAKSRCRPLGKVSGQRLTCSRATESGKPWRKRSWILAMRAKRSKASDCDAEGCGSFFMIPVYRPQTGEEIKPLCGIAWTRGPPVGHHEGNGSVTG